MKSISLLTLVLAAALAGCDAGIAGSSESSPSGSNGPSACPTMGGQPGACKDSAAAAQSGACPSTVSANPNCANGKCEQPGDCGKPQCEPKQCEEMPCDETKCDESMKQDCKSQEKCEPKSSNQ